MNEVFIISVTKATDMIVTNKAPRGQKTLRLPLQESDYPHFTSDVIFARKRVDELYQESPELFPAKFKERMDRETST